MALPGNTVIELRNVADFAGVSDTNGGGFISGGSGTDYSYTNIQANGGPQYSVSNGVTNGTTTITSATANFGTDVVDNLISVSGGTGAVVQNWYRIVSRTNNTTIVVDRLTGLTAGTGVILKIGGALATPGGLGAFLALNFVSGMRAYWRYSATNFTITTATPNVSGGIFSLPSATNNFWLIGYDQARGDRTGNRPKMNWGAVAAPGSITFMITTGAGITLQEIQNVLVDGNNVNNVGGISLSTARHAIFGCVAQNCSGTAGVGFLGTASGLTSYACAAINCVTGFSGGVWEKCYATTCTTGFNNCVPVIECLAYSNTNGFITTAAGFIYIQCTSDSNTTAGFTLAGSGILFGCIASNHSGGGGIGYSFSVTAAHMRNCFSYNNTTEISGTPFQENTTLSAAFTGGQPYILAGSDFRPNNIAGSGMLLQDVLPGVFGQNDNVDANAVQHSDPVGGGANLSRIFSGF